MIQSQIFYTDVYRDIEAKNQSLLNSHEDFLSPMTVNSPRAVGDAIEEILRTSFASVLGDLCDEYSAQFARRAMADMAFRDVDGLYYVVDVKTHRTDTAFNMPNLTSVERLARFYEDDTNYFAVLMISYHIEAARPQVTHRAHRVLKLGLPHPRGTGMGADSNCQCQSRHGITPIFSQEVDASVV